MPEKKKLHYKCDGYETNKKYPYLNKKPCKKTQENLTLLKKQNEILKQKQNEILKLKSKEEEIFL